MPKLALYIDGNTPVATDMFDPVAIGELELEMNRKGQPSCLRFSVAKDTMIDFVEGQAVRLEVDKAKMFFGFVFTKTRTKEGIIHVECYDQMKYLVMNKLKFAKYDMSATEVIQELAGAYGLQLGSIADTGHKIEFINEDGSSLMDIIQNALAETTVHTGELFVLYDEFGKLTLKSVKEMHLDFMIDQDTGEDYDYTSSIEEQTYNTVILYYTDKETGEEQVFVKKNAENIKQWGIISYFENVNTPIGADAKASALLKLYDAKTRKLTLKNALGNTSVFAGCSIGILLNLGDILVSQMMMVNSVKHRFHENYHFMDVNMVGGEFIA